MFKKVFLQFLYDLSDREVEERATFDMSFKWFLWLSADDLPPDHTTLCRFRQGLGPEEFQQLFTGVVEQAREQGLVSHRLHILDATHMEAKVDLFRGGNRGVIMSKRGRLRHPRNNYKACPKV